ncbi:MAG: hypothetical protein HQ558_04895 [Candidatus Omnitrophica bacterium]|nr:hypothetical protein [Candidatus Omnitrophota bacterium]
MKKFIFPAVLIVTLSALLTSCAPTYPREKMIEGVKRLCKKEYGVEVEVKVENETLGVRMPLEGLFNAETLQIAPEAMDKITGVMLSVSRVALSSDRSIEFYTIIATDKNVLGAEIVMTRYVVDLRRYFYGDISRGEFARRMVFDVRLNPQGIIDTWLGGFTFKETTLDSFICAQISRRILDEFRDNKMLAGKFKVSSCDVKLEKEVFLLSVEIAREGLPMSELIHGTSWHDKVLELCLKTASYVIYVYDFKDFEKITAHNKFDNKTMDIDKGQIKVWRKRRIRIE